RGPQDSAPGRHERQRSESDHRDHAHVASVHSIPSSCRFSSSGRHHTPLRNRCRRAIPRPIWYTAQRVCRNREGIWTARSGGFGTVRRGWIALARTAFFAAVAIVSFSRGSFAAEPRPHILYIVADDLGWKDVGYHGSDIETPNIDRLAAQGVRLEQFYAQPM